MTQLENYMVGDFPEQKQPWIPSLSTPRYLVLKIPCTSTHTLVSRYIYIIYISSNWPVSSFYPSNILPYHSPEPTTILPFLRQYDFLSSLVFYPSDYALEPTIILYFSRAHSRLSVDQFYILRNIFLSSRIPASIDRTFLPFEYITIL